MHAHALAKGTTDFRPRNWSALSAADSDGQRELLSTSNGETIGQVKASTH